MGNQSAVLRILILPPSLLPLCGGRRVFLSVPGGLGSSFLAHLGSEHPESRCASDDLQVSNHTEPSEQPEE